MFPRRVHVTHERFAVMCRWKPLDLHERLTRAPRLGFTEIPRWSRRGAVVQLATWDRVLVHADVAPARVRQLANLAEPTLVVRPPLRRGERVGLYPRRDVPQQVLVVHEPAQLAVVFYRLEVAKLGRLVEQVEIARHALGGWRSIGVNKPTTRETRDATRDTHDNREDGVAHRRI